MAAFTVTMPDNIMFGSDYPFVPGEILTKVIDKVRANILTDAELGQYTEDFFSGNVLKLSQITNTSDNNMVTEKRMVEKLPMAADGIVRLSKIEVDPQYLDEYTKFATEVGEVSLLTEPEALTMYAVADRQNPCNITILETSIT